MRLLQYVPPAIASVGGAMYGIDTGIIATTIGHESWSTYMFGPSGNNSAALTGATVSVYNAGQAVATFLAGWLANRISRKYTLTVAAAVAIVGIILQTAAVDIGMFIAGRLITGAASGMALTVVPVYIAELSKPESRAILVGFQGMAIAIGFFIANWIGYSGIYAHGNLQWRIPLATQFFFPLILLFGSAFLPFSPRWLVTRERYEDAREVLVEIFVDPDLAEQQLAEIREQIALEATYTGEGWLATFKMLFWKQYRLRVFLACFIQFQTQWGGVGVLQNFQNVFYKQVGITGNYAELIDGFYGFMGVFGQLANLLVVADRLGRRTTLWCGCLVLTVILSVAMAMSAQFAHQTNQAAARTTIGFIYMYSAFFALFFNSTMWVLPSELLPVFLRSQGMGLSTFTLGVSSIVVSQITPYALDGIGWRFYAIFIAITALSTLVYYFVLPETKGKHLEEIGALFGDISAINDVDISKPKALESKGVHMEQKSEEIPSYNAQLS